jgi:fumarate hydratase subunit alpha
MEVRDVLVRKIEVSQIKGEVKRLWMEANFVLPSDVMDALKEAEKRENSEMGRDVLGKIIENALIAKRKRVPICQDTGIPVVFVFAGQEVQITGGKLEEAIEQGIGEGTREGFLRSSVVDDALTRVNTGDNTPPVVHTEIVSGDNLRIVVMPKGAGSENMSGLAMLKPADGKNGIKAFILRQVESAGANACPPMVVGVGIGGTAEKAMQLAKKACARPLTERSRKMAEFEEELLEEINCLGIGPAGLGGRTTALAVNIKTASCHMASLPVAVNINCHACRRKEAIL